jgi:prepilin-type N-terminal cleavage/methylation domain-containing protein
MRRRGGFTLIELLMVMLIVGILLAMLLPAVSGVRRAVRGRETEQRITTLTGHIERYKSVFGYYPPSTPAGVSGHEEDIVPYWNYPPYVDTNGSEYKITWPGGWGGNRVMGGGMLVYFLLGPDGTGWDPQNSDTKKRSMVRWEAPEGIDKWLIGPIGNGTQSMYYFQDGFGWTGYHGRGTIFYYRANSRTGAFSYYDGQGSWYWDTRTGSDLGYFGDGLGGENYKRQTAQAVASKTPFILMSNGADSKSGYFIIDSDGHWASRADGSQIDDITSFVHE